VKVNEWMDFFSDNKNKKIFSLNDLKVLTGDNTSTISVQLSRLSRSGLVKNPIKGWYTNPFNSPSSEELSMVLRAPAYLSLEYALSKHGILSQDVHTYTLITTKLPYTFRSNEDIYEYHQISRSLFWGYGKEENIQIADPEKALLDLIYIRYSRKRNANETLLLSLMDDMYLEDIDEEILKDYSNKYDSATKDFIVKNSVIL
jgi:hypothetical protein